MAAMVTSYIASEGSASNLETLWSACGLETTIVTLTLACFIVIRGIVSKATQEEKKMIKQFRETTKVAQQDLDNYEVITEPRTSITKPQSMPAERGSQVGANRTNETPDVLTRKVLSLLSPSVFDISAAADFLKESVAELSHPNSKRRSEVLLTKFFKACATRPSRQSAQVACQVYQATQDNVEYTRGIYHALVCTMVRAGESENADMILREMTLRNVMPDLELYSAMIRGSISQGDLERALQLLSSMQRRSVKPDLPLFQLVLDVCAQRLMPSLVESILIDMGDSEVSPSNATLATLIRLYGKCGDLGAAYHLFRTYPEKYGFTLNSQAYSSLISACIADGDVSGARDIYQQMVRSGCSSDAASYQALLPGLLQDGKLDQAASLIDDAVSCGNEKLLPKSALELFLRQAVRRQRGSELAVPVLQHMQKAGISISQHVVDSVRECADC
eukprot:TRINITY_DN1268_c0_g1_i2.p1 TRINITY_DN1268_c0_g1~~TRINITY_DN1268_c0_g1_i2.p1  ORF type:complete len:475 (+),score=72.48 TRINITY_DN1268_c0_g1_i2:83-1426(+)